MRHLFDAILALTLLAMAVALGGCSASSASNGSNIVVDVTNAFTYAQIGESPVTLTVTVANDNSKSGVKWQLSTAGVACSPGCGTLVPSSSPSFSAVYTPPSKAPLNQQATIIATSVADSRQDYAFIFSIIPPASVTITNKFTSIFVGAAPVQVNATTQNDPNNAGVTWTLTAGGANCSPACGTLSAPSASPNLSTTYTPPSTYSSGANSNPTITATSVANPAASDSFAFTINNTTAFFKGSYAFLLRGYYAGVTPEVPMSVAGTLTADGNGNITNAEFDFDNDGGITEVAGPQSGTYTVSLSPTGVVEAFITLTSFTFSSGVAPQFRCVLSADGTRGRMIELDAGAFLNAGTIELQDTTAISTKPAGNFVFGVDSDAPYGARTVAAGQMVLGAGVTGGLIDQSSQANLAPVFVDQALSADSLGSPDAFGRGTLNITASGKTVNYAYYIVDSTHLYLIEIDPGTAFGTVFAGNARLQKSLTAASVNGVNVIQMTGFDVPSGTNTVLPVVIVGLLTVSGGNSYSLQFDINDIGQVLIDHGDSGTVAFDPTTGRAAVTDPNGFGSNFMNAGAWYLYDQGKGFYVEEDISTSGAPGPNSVTNRALSGTTLPQVGAPFQLTSISGNALAGFGASSTPDVPNGELALNLVSPTGTGTGASVLGNYTALGDLTSVLSEGGKVPGFQATAGFGFQDANNLAIGHGLIQLPAPVFGNFGAPPGTNYLASFYMIAPNQFVGIGISNSGFGLVPPYTGVIFLDPQ